MLPSTEIRIPKDYKNSKVKKPSLVKPIIEGVLFVVFLLLVVGVVYLGQEMVAFVKSLVH